MIFNIISNDDYLKSLCIHKKPLIQAALNADKNGTFWETILSQLSMNNREVNNSKEKSDENFHIGCRLITILTKDVFVPKQYAKEIILRVLERTKSTREEIRFEKLLKLAEKARVRNKTEVCVLILNELDNEIRRLESDRDQLELEEKYKSFLTEVKFKYKTIEQSLKQPEGHDADRSDHEKKRFIDDLLKELEVGRVETEKNDDHRRRKRRRLLLEEWEIENGKVVFNKEFGSTNDLNRVAMHGAAFKNQLSSIRDLSLIFPEYVNAKDDRGMTPFMVACANNSFDAANVLLELGADPFDKDNCECNALIHLMKADGDLDEEESLKRYDLFKKLINSNDQVFAFDRDRKSALHWAIITRKERYAMELIDLVDENAQTSFLEEIFYFCYQCNSERLFNYLLDKKKSLKIACEKLFEKAWENRDGDVIYFFIKARIDVYQLIKEGLSEENAWQFEVLFSKAISTFRDSTGRTPLMIACANNDFDTAMVLLDLKANLQLEDYYGRTALIHLMKNSKKMNEEESVKQYHLFKKLTFLNDKIFAFDIDRNTALHWAMITGKEKYVFELIDLIENNQVDLLENVLTQACQYNLIKFVEYLLLSGKCSNINYDKISRFLIKTAYFIKNSIIIYFLVKAGIDIDEKLGELLVVKSSKKIKISERKRKKIFEEMVSKYREDSGMTPLMIACARNDIKVANELIKLGADKRSVDFNGNTALFHFLKNPIPIPLYDENSERDELFDNLVLDLFCGDNEGTNALGCALISGKERYAWKLVQLINKNSPAGVLEDAFECGCRYNLKYIIKELLNKKNLIHIFIEKELWFLRIALKYKNIMIINELIELGVNIRTLFYDICEKQDFESLKFLIENDVHPPDLYIENFPLIHWILITCCKLDDPILFDIALKMVYKIDINTRGLARCAVIHAAVMAKHVELVKILLDLGADINDRDNDFSATPLDLALDPTIPPDPQRDEIVKILRNKTSSQDVIVIN